MINRFVSFLVDTALVTIFVIIGMMSHSTPWGDFLGAVWPFWVGLVAGWFVWVLMKPDLKATSLPVGLIVWIATVAIGLTLRILSGGSATGAFPYVTLGVTALFLLGWRLIYVIANRSRTDKETSRSHQQSRNATPGRVRRVPSKAEDRAALAEHTSGRSRDRRDKDIETPRTRENDRERLDVSRRDEDPVPRARDERRREDRDEDLPDFLR